MTLSSHAAHQAMWQAHRLLGQGRLTEAEALYAEAVDAFVALGMGAAEGEGRANLGLCRLSQGRATDAERELSEALVLAQVAEQRVLERAVCEALGGLWSDRGRPDEALGVLQRALELAQAEGVRQRLGGARLALAQAHRELDQLELAQALVDAAEADAAATWDDGLALAAAGAGADLALLRGDSEGALRRRRVVLEQATRPADRASASLGLAAVLVERSWEGAEVPVLEIEELLHQAGRHAADQGDETSAASARLLMAGLSGALEQRSRQGGDRVGAARLGQLAHTWLAEGAELTAGHPTREAEVLVLRWLLSCGQVPAAVATGDGALLGSLAELAAEAEHALERWSPRSARVRRAGRWLALSGQTRPSVRSPA